MKQILLKLTAGEKLTRRETQEILVGITEQKYSNEQISALLMALNVRGITTDELLGFRDGILQTGTPVDLSPYKVLDIVGTGGDGKNTFNISTCSCFVVAGAGYKVAKHGNYASTSVSGASNVIEEPPHPQPRRMWFHVLARAVVCTRDEVCGPREEDFAGADLLQFVGTARESKPPVIPNARHCQFGTVEALSFNMSGTWHRLHDCYKS